MIAFLLLLTISSLPLAEPGPAQRAWGILKDGVDDKSGERRARAVHALGLAKGRQAQAMAEKALSDQDKDVRSEAAVALGLMNAVTARPKLRACLDDAEIQVVLACTNTLFQFKDPSAYEIYYALLTGERKTGKGLLKGEMATLHDKKQVEKLAFETGIGFVPYGGMGWQAIKTIAHDDESPVRALAAERLANDPRADSAKALNEYSTDKKWLVRRAVVEAIEKRGDPALLNTAETMLDDENESVRFEAAATVVYLSERRGRRPQSIQLKKATKPPA